MAPAKISNLRGGSVSPNVRPYDTSVIKVGGEVFDRDGYRMDVTVWFRHRNEVLFYLDSGGSVHGPMDQKHSTRLGNISRSGQLIPGSRHYLSDGGAGWSHERDVMRHQSDSGAWDARSENIYRGRTYSESRRPFLSERTHEHSSSSSRYYAYQQQQTYPQHHFKTTASHQVGTHSPSTHISRWSSMQGMGTSGTWRGSSGNRYATTLTRQHIKRHRDPVEMLVKHPPSMGASKVDLVSIDTRRGSSPPLHYSPNTYSYRQFETESITERERRLRDELVNTQRELQELKRSRSLTGDLNLMTSSTAKENLKSTSTQYLNESSWTTHTLKKNDGLPCGAPVAAAPYRATSQVNIAGRTNLGRPQWQSDLNLRTTTSYKQTPMLSTYSAHRENLQRREEQRRNFEDGTSRQFSTRYFDESKTVGGGAEVMEEVETITLQPIGRGVHDLEPVGSIARSVRTNTPTGSYPLVPLQTRPHSSAGRLYYCSPKAGNPPRTGFTLTRSSSQPPPPYRSPSTVKNGIRSSFREIPVGISAQQHMNARFAPSDGSPTFFRYDSNAMNAYTPRGSLIYPSNQPSIVAQNKAGTVQVTNSSVQHPRLYQNQQHSPQHRPAATLEQNKSQQFDYSNSVPRHPSSPSTLAARYFSTAPTQKQSLQSSSPTGFVSRAFTPAGFDQSDGYRTIATTNLHREVHTSGAPSPYPGTHHSPYYDSNTRSSEQRYHTVQHTGQQIRATTVPPNYTGNTSGASGGLVDGVDWQHQELMKQAKNTFREWYLPDASRDDVIYMLRDRDPGSFIIRNSISCVNSFSLGVKAPPYPPQNVATSDFLRSGQVKHFIIGTVPMYDGRGDGVQLCGFNDQPVFPALTDFVSHHCLHPGPLPCALRLPSGTSTSQQRLSSYESTNKYGVPAGGSGIMVDMLYLGCVPVDRLEKAAAIRKAISHIFGLAASSTNGLPRRCEVTIHAKPVEGVKFTDRSKRNLVEKHLKPSQILFCGSDPEGRTYVDAGLRSRGFLHAKIFGILIRKKQFWMHENLVYVFSELDPNQSAVTLINYISHMFTS